MVPTVLLYHENLLDFRLTVLGMRFVYCEDTLSRMRLLKSFVYGNHTVSISSVGAFDSACTKLKAFVAFLGTTTVMSFDKVEW